MVYTNGQRDPARGRFRDLRKCATWSVLPRGFCVVFVAVSSMIDEKKMIRAYFGEVGLRKTSARIM